MTNYEGYNFEPYKSNRRESLTDRDKEIIIGLLKVGVSATQVIRFSRLKLTAKIVRNIKEHDLIRTS